jgi:hypothetical protein
VTARLSNLLQCTAFVMPELKSAYLTAQNFKTALAVKSWGVSNALCAQAIDQAQGVCVAARLFLCVRIDVSFADS